MEKWCALPLFFLLSLAAPGILLAGPPPPMNIGALPLGEDIHNYKDRVDIDSCQKIRYQEYLSEGMIKPCPGFKSGLVSFGLCDQVNKIVRIKLKFLNPSKKFFKRLLNQYKKHLGPPDEYKGDPFQTMIAWKWSFTTQTGDNISLTLQHNLADTDEKIGNAVKMTLTDQIDREKACYLKKYPEKKGPRTFETLTGPEMWEMYVPH